MPVSGLADLSPGPALGAALAGIELSSVTGEQLVDVLRAQGRQRAYQEGQYLAAIVELGRAVPGEVERLPSTSGWAASEVAAALTWTGQAAEREVEFAEMVVRNLPSVHAAMCAGTIDRARAWVFADLLTDLTPAQRAVICAALVPVAGGLTTGQLRARLLRMIKEVDPAWADRRYRQALSKRRLVGYLNADGTVTITASGLPIPEAAAACERLRRLAARIRRAGHPDSLDEIKADLFLGMTDGTLHFLHDQQIVALFLARAQDAANGHTGSSTDGDTEPARASDDAAVPEPTRTGVEIRVSLTTLLERDERCGEIPGLGPVLPSVARELVASQQHGTEWRFAVTDSQGYLIFGGTTRCRPYLSSNRPARSRGGVVELHVPADVLEQLVTDGPAVTGPWAALISDIAAQYADRHRLLARLDAHPNDRFARAELARHIQLRDRTCRGIGCRRPAGACHDYALGGRTVAANLGPFCDRHHGHKTKGWWRLRQPRPGQFEWTSPLKHIYRARGEPISLPTVAPRPRSARRESTHPPPQSGAPDTDGEPTANT